MADVWTKTETTEFRLNMDLLLFETKNISWLNSKSSQNGRCFGLKYAERGLFSNKHSTLVPFVL